MILNVTVPKKMMKFVYCSRFSSLLCMTTCSFVLCAQNPRYIEISGLLVAAVSYFFVGPPKFFGEPYVFCNCIYHK